jgi:hypothetical protein
VKFDVESESFRTFLPAEKFVYHSSGLKSQTVRSIAVANLIVSTTSLLLTTTRQLETFSFFL